LIDKEGIHFPYFKTTKEKRLATKNLARTAIEGGRQNSSKNERRFSHRTDRMRERAFLSVVRRDHEQAADLLVEESGGVYKEFADKLAPVRRWLDSRVGRPWSEIRSEIARKFDLRTTPGRHIVLDHIFSDVNHLGEEERPFSRYRYKVNAEGILEKGPRRKRYLPSSLEMKYAENKKKAESWLAERADRKVGLVGNKLYWFLRPTLRQGPALTSEEVSFFKSLDQRLQLELIDQAPTSAALAFEREHAAHQRSYYGFLGVRRENGESFCWCSACGTRETICYGNY
jgi:hypothetical protein